MTSTAISAQGSTLQVASSTGTPATLTTPGVTLGFPTIITAAAHGFKNGDVITFSSIVGTVQLNGQTAVIRDVKTNTFAIDIDSTGYTAWTSAGTATPAAWTSIANFKTIKGFDGKVAKIDATNLSSLAKEWRAGLIDPGQFTFDCDVDMSDAGQLALRANLIAGTISNYKLTLPNTHTATFQAFVESFPMDGGVDKIITSTVSLIITGPITYS